MLVSDCSDRDEQSVTISALLAQRIMDHRVALAHAEDRLRVAVDSALASVGIDATPALQWRVELVPPRLFYTLPDTPDTPPDAS